MTRLTGRKWRKLAKFSEEDMRNSTSSLGSQGAYLQAPSCPRWLGLVGTTRCGLRTRRWIPTNCPPPLCYDECVLARDQCIEWSEDRPCRPLPSPCDRRRGDCDDRMIIFYSFSRMKSNNFTNKYNPIIGNLSNRILGSVQGPDFSAFLLARPCSSHEAHQLRCCEPTGVCVKK